MCTRRNQQIFPNFFSLPPKIDKKEKQKKKEKKEKLVDAICITVSTKMMQQSVHMYAFMPSSDTIIKLMVTFIMDSILSLVTPSDSFFLVFFFFVFWTSV